MPTYTAYLKDGKRVNRGALAEHLQRELQKGSLDDRRSLTGTDLLQSLDFMAIASVTGRGDYEVQEEGVEQAYWRMHRTGQEENVFLRWILLASNAEGLAHFKRFLLEEYQAQVWYSPR